MDFLTSEILNRILIQFNLIWKSSGLFYIHKLRFGKMEFFITKDEYKVYKFLELPYIPSEDVENLYYCIANSPYFNVRQFLNLSVESKKYKSFLKKIKEEKPVTQYQQICIVNYNAVLVDYFFNTKILSKILSLEPKGISNKAIRNKFNGNLVKTWASLQPGKYLRETMEDFKEYIEELFGYGFLEYLIHRSPKEIRSDFLYFYTENIKLDKDNNLPF